MSDSTKPPFTFTANFSANAASAGNGAREQNQVPFCIALLGNFSCRQDTNESSKIGERNFVSIDRYNLDEVFASMAIDLTLCLNQDDNTKVRVALSSMKDFHPDKLYKNIELFSHFRDLRSRLKNPKTFKQAAQELGAFDQDEKPLPPPEEPKNNDAQPLEAEKATVENSGVSFLDSILDATEGKTCDSDDNTSSSSVSKQTSKSMVDDFIRQLFTDKHKVKSRDPRQGEMVAIVDEAIALHMRSILHNPQFQALESCWRALNFIVKRIPKNKPVKLYLLDVSQEELAIDLDTRDVTQTHLYSLFGDKSKGDVDWNLIVGDYRFGPHIDDVLMLSQLGFIAQHAGAQFFAAADEKLVGCNAFGETPNPSMWLDDVDPLVEQAWATIRKSQVAKNICLALPRFILREPYGSNSATVKSFAFEEMSSPPQHEEYLWGNPAFLKAEQISKAFIETGWEMRFSEVLKTEDLPLHYYEHNNRSVIKPCAEIPLSDKGAQKMVAQGLIPLWSVKDTDKIHSASFHSIAE